MNELQNEHTKSQNLQVWYCCSCQNVHFKTANVMLDFSKNEFIDLTKAMLEIFKNEFDPIELNKLSDSIELSNDVLSSEIIA